MSDVPSPGGSSGWALLRGTWVITGFVGGAETGGQALAQAPGMRPQLPHKLGEPRCSADPSQGFRPLVLSPSPSHPLPGAVSDPGHSQTRGQPQAWTGAARTQARQEGTVTCWDRGHETAGGWWSLQRGQSHRAPGGAACEAPSTDAVGTVQAGQRGPAMGRGQGGGASWRHNAEHPVTRRPCGFGT